MKDNLGAQVIFLPCNFKNHIQFTPFNDYELKKDKGKVRNIRLLLHYLISNAYQTALQF